MIIKLAIKLVVICYVSSCYSSPFIKSLTQCCSGKEPACQCRRHKKCGFSLWMVKIPWQPTLVFFPREFHGQISLEGYSPKGLQRVRHDWSDLAYTHTHRHTHTDCLARRLFSSIHGPCLLHAKRTLPQVMTFKNASKHCQMSPWGQNHHCPGTTRLIYF